MLQTAICPICGEDAEYQGEERFHSVTHRRERFYRLYECDFCGSNFSVGSTGKYVRVQAERKPLDGVMEWDG